MQIKWLGHAAFAIITDKGKTILTDPYEAGSYDGAVGYPKISVQADLVTVSHQHADHNDTKSLFGNPKIIDKEGKYDIDDIKITGVSCFHDQSEGKERGGNIIFIYEIDGFRLAHLGDMGHMPTQEQFNKIGEIDILLIPIGGHFTIDSKEATQIVANIIPKVTIPMHYKTEVLGFPIAPVDDFIKDKSNVKRIEEVEIFLTKDDLPSESEIWVLPYVV